LHDILKRGGFPLLPKSLVVKCLRGSREAIPQHDRFNNKRYYQYGLTSTSTPACFKEQRDSGNYIPEFVDGFYIQEGGNFFPNEVKVLKSQGYCCQQTTNGASVNETTSDQASVQATINGPSVQEKTPEIDAPEISNPPEKVE
jgi:hypothetical protein